MQTCRPPQARRPPRYLRRPSNCTPQKNASSRANLPTAAQTPRPAAAPHRPAIFGALRTTSLTKTASAAQNKYPVPRPPTGASVSHYAAAPLRACLAPGLVRPRNPVRSLPHYHLHIARSARTQSLLPRSPVSDRGNPFLRCRAFSISPLHSLNQPS